MVEQKYEVTAYRWVVLGVFMFVAALTQLLWINFAAISIESAAYYGVSTDEIDLLSLIFMLVYIGLAIPSAWVIDTKGLKLGATVGAILTGVFGVCRIFAGTNYLLVFIFQTGIACGQPFVMNAISKLSTQWFPEGERAVATGLGTMALFIGIFLGMLLPPILFGSGGIPMVLIVLGVLGAVGMGLFLLFIKEKPEKPPSPAAIEEKIFVWDGIKKFFKMRNGIILMLLFFVGMGSFNAIATFINQIITPKGYTSLDAGIIGALIVLGGIIGAIVISGLSDKFRKRKVFVYVALGGALPFLLGITFIPIFTLLIIVGLLFGFFLMSSLPIGLQFAAEQTAPVPEGTSNGILIMMGQIGGVVLILAFFDFVDMTIPMIILVILLAVALISAIFLRETPLQKLTEGN